MKDGGANVRVLGRPASRNDVESHLREWVGVVFADNEPPDAYAAVAFWVDKDTPGRPAYSIGYVTQTDALPLGLLTEIAGIYLRNDLIASVSENRTMTAMGYTRPPWTPSDE